MNTYSEHRLSDVNHSAMIESRHQQTSSCIVSLVIICFDNTHSYKLLWEKELNGLQEDIPQPIRRKFQFMVYER